MRASEQILFILAFMFLTSILEAQYSGGGGSGGSGSSGSGGSSGNLGSPWPSNLSYPNDLPQRIQGLYAPAGVTWSGNLEDGFTATYVASNGSSIEYEWMDDPSVNSIPPYFYQSARHFSRYAYRKNSNGTLVTSSIGGFFALRASLNGFSRTQPGSLDKILQDVVKCDGYHFKSEINASGDLEAILVELSHEANVRTENSSIKADKAVKSTVVSKPTTMQPTLPDLSETFSVDLRQNLGVDWRLARQAIVTGSLGSLPLTESGTYPISAPGNTGSLSVSELEFISQIVSVTSNWNHIVSLSWLNPPPQNRNIYHFANFPDSFVWTFPPFP